MPDFLYQAVDRQGHRQKGELAAESAAAAVRSLNADGHTVIEVRERQAQSPTTFGARLRVQETSLALHQLATLLEAGVALGEAIAAQSQSAFKPALADAFARMDAQLMRGERFGAALRESQLPLPDYVFQLVEAGETSGRLAESLRQAVSQMNYDHKVAADLRGALAYPVILVTAGLAAILFVFMFVVPRFSNLLEGDLPWLAAAVLHTGLWFNDNALWALAGAAAMLFAAAALWRQSRMRQALLDSLARLPLLGAWFAEAETARWAAIMSAMLQSRVELMDALALAVRGIRTSRRRAALAQALVDVRAGQPLSDALQRGKAVTAAGCNLVRVGERSGQLAAMLASLARLYEENSSRRMARFINLIEPLAILLIGGFLGTIMIGIILAITSVNESVL